MQRFRRQIITGLSMEKFTIEITDTGLAVTGNRGNQMEFTAAEALMLLDILKNEESELREMADAASPLFGKANV
jgi:hypothetical protein